MAKDGIDQVIKRELFSALLERISKVDLTRFGAPAEEDAVKFDNVEEILNVPYMNRSEIPLGMDIFKPIVPEGTELPVIVTIHGGGLYMGDRKLSRPFCRVLANKGYLVFSIEYRLIPKADVCMELDDICAGLDLIGRKLVDFDVDFNRIFIAAESAGAYLAAYVTAMKGSKELQKAIGYEPTNVTFKAIGLMSGMLYINGDSFDSKILAEQVYGSKRTDENFLQYMDPEHPEIINHLPPAYIITSKADFLSSYSIRINEALKKAGKPCHLLYYGSDELQHAFTTMQTEHPKALDSIDKMLLWFEEQAELTVNRRKKAKTLEKKQNKIRDAIIDGSFDNQKTWKYIKEKAGIYPERMSAPAIIDCSRTYTYAQMFQQWENYARVFSSLKISGANQSRVAVAGSIGAETLFTCYGLNMTGACVSMFSCLDFLPGGKWKSMVEKEQITDIIISDFVVTPKLLQELKDSQKKFQIRNIILLHSRIGGAATGYAEMTYNEFNYHALKRLPDIRFMDELLSLHKDSAIRYGRKGSNDIAVICHTYNGTDDGRMPLPFTDEAINHIASSQIKKDIASTEEEVADEKRKISIAALDFSVASSLLETVNTSFAGGDAVVTTFFGALHPKFLQALKYYKITHASINSLMIDQWMTLPDLDIDAFITLKSLNFGSSSFASNKLAIYEAFLRNHGFTGTLDHRFTAFELLCGLPDPSYCNNRNQYTIGYPDNLDDFRIYDKSDDTYHRISDGQREGMLYGRCDVMPFNELDKEKLYDVTEVDGNAYICLNHRMRVNSDGSLSYYDGNCKDNTAVFETFESLYRIPEFYRYRQYQKLQMKAFKATVEEVKSRRPEFKFKLPEMDDGLPSIAELPKSLRTAITLFGILSGDQEIRDYDFED